MKFFDSVGHATATTGMGTMTLGASLGTSFFTFAQQGAADGDEVYYRIDDGGDVEIGIGTIGGTVTTLSRDTVLSSLIGGTAGTTKLTLSGAAQVRCVHAAEAIVQSIDEDDMASDDDTKVPTQQSVKAYVDSRTGWELIETLTPSGVATLDITSFDAAKYEQYSIEIEHMAPASDSQTLRIRFSTDGGSSFISGATAYKYAWVQALEGGSASDVGSTGTDHIRISGGIGNSTNEHVSGTIFIRRPHESAYTLVQFRLMGLNDSGQFSHIDGGGVNTSQNVVDAIRLYFASGNIASGRVTVWGLRIA